MASLGTVFGRDVRLLPWQAPYTALKTVFPCFNVISHLPWNATSGYPAVEVTMPPQYLPRGEEIPVGSELITAHATAYVPAPPYPEWE